MRKDESFRDFWFFGVIVFAMLILFLTNIGCSGSGTPASPAIPIEPTPKAVLEFEMTVTAWGIEFDPFYWWLEYNTVTSEKNGVGFDIREGSLTFYLDGVGIIVSIPVQGRVEANQTITVVNQYLTGDWDFDSWKIGYKGIDDNGYTLVFEFPLPKFWEGTSTLMKSKFYK